MRSRSLVLIADDDPDVLELLKVYLRPLGCDVITATDGDQALEVAQRELPDVVLLDVLMPKRTGWEVCQALRAVHRTSEIGIVLITGKGEVKDRLTGLQVGADDYLVKPFHRGEVLKRVGELLANRRDGSSSGADGSEPSPPPARPAALRDDPASGLPTISVVLDRLKEIMIEQSQLGVIYIDIEQFEAIEADYGWAFFDEFIRCVGEVISSEAKGWFDDPVVAVGRMAGSNFYIFVEMKVGKNRDSLEQIAERLRVRLVESLRERFPKMHSKQIGFFTGAACIQYEPQLRLERQIYTGMQTAVDAVRNAEQQRKRQLMRELREIIRKKRVTTLFQPIVHAADSSLFGYEILTRGPAQSSFRNSDMLFSFARETKLAWELEALALESSLDRLRNIDLSDQKFLLNLEAEMFEVSELRFHDMVDFFSERRGSFVFELTERAAIQDYGVFRGLLEEFRAKGIEIAIDDAGSGYASLEAIASLAPDYLKVTKGLISTLAQEPIKQDLVKMLVELAHKIGARTIAEGIETAEEFEWCRDLGIDLMQGYYIARPQVELIKAAGSLVPAGE